MEQEVIKGSKNGFSIASMVVGIVSMFIPYIGLIIGILGIVLGVIGLHEVKDKEQEGKGFAIVGIVCSGVTITYFLIIISLFSFGLIGI